MWLTIEGQGLVKIEEQTKDNFYFNIYQTEDGLKDLTVFYMTSDKHGGLWIVNNGRALPQSLQQPFMLTDERNGLLGTLV